MLVEGPPDADDLLPLIVNPAMQPPVALLVFSPDQPKRAVFYPFAIFSPEWQALHYALTHNVTARFMDLPQAHRLAIESEISDHESELRLEPLQHLAEAAGHDDGERWWEQMVEHRRSSIDLFAAISEAMGTLRESLPPSPDPIEAQREAFMRQTIRAARGQGFDRIAVVCGAWHALALDVDSKTTPSAKEDAALLKGLAKTRVQATWTPWTYGRLSYASGYGAGIESPGWYHHLWSVRDATVIRWMARVAGLLREADIDVSSAHLIEAVRLAESLAALRDRPLPGLTELNEATQAVICFGNDLPLQLIHDKLIVGETLGQVPEETPMSPLQLDLQREQKRLRLKPEAGERQLDLDLRKENDLDRSRLLHRLSLLGVDWGDAQSATGKGTFHEIWRLRWRPELAVNLIEASVWGKTIVEAATNFALDVANKADDLPALTNLVDRTLLADLPEAVARVMSRLHSAAALASDVAHLMDALPPLANVRRYGNVRQTDAAMVGEVVNGLVARICVGLPGACASMNDEAASQMFDRTVSANGAIELLQNEELVTMWRKTLAQMAGQNGLHGLLAGRCCRLLLDARVFANDEAARRLSFALAVANEPQHAAAWVEGFLKGSGLVLLYDESLWRVIDEWVTNLSGENFVALLPLVRRTFSTFTVPERRQMGERVRRGGQTAARAANSRQPGDADFDQRLAEAVLPMTARLLGVKPDEA